MTSARGTASDEESDPGLNLFVANLSNDVTDGTLENVFSPFGDILSAKVMLDIHTGNSRGFGFVLFKRKECGVKAMAAIHGTAIGARQVFISVAKTNGMSGIQQTPKLYIRNVPRVLSLEHLRRHFSKFGNLVKICFRDDGTQGNAPAAHRDYLATTQVLFMEYETAAEADEAVRSTHNTRPWPHLNMLVPLLAKPAETSDMRNARRQRQSQQRTTDAAESPATPPAAPLHPAPHIPPVLHPAASPVMMVPMPLSGFAGFQPQSYPMPGPFGYPCGVVSLETFGAPLPVNAAPVMMPPSGGVAHPMALPPPTHRQPLPPTTFLPPPPNSYFYPPR